MGRTGSMQCHTPDHPALSHLHVHSSPAVFLVLRVVKERTSGARIALPVQGGGAATNGASAYHAVGDAGLELSALTMSDKERFG